MIHFYGRIGVAIVELEAPLKIGQTIRFVRGGEDLFDQKVASLEQEHKKLDYVDTGEVGIETKKPVKEGAEVFTITKD